MAELPLNVALLCQRQATMNRPEAHPPSYTYEDICEIVPIFIAHSLTPVTVKELNLLIEKFVTKCGGSIEYIGGHSVILLSPEGIAAKISFKAGDPRLSNEQRVLELLEKTSSLHIPRCFLCRPDVIFMPFVSFWTLNNRMTEGKPSRPILSWMLQLAGATAALKAIGFTHGDIKNILVDDQDALKLVDFDHAVPIGSDIDVGYEPYIRAHRIGKGGGGTYGIADEEQSSSP